jgi:ABC-type nickel/cobalt efflux system permease component RcnA
MIQNTLRASEASPVFNLMAILVAFTLGGLHALTPGHNTVLTGAFLVSAGGKIRHAILVGGATAFSHTASVIIIGLLALSSPGQAAITFFLRWLGVPSGLLVAGLGLWLLIRHLQGQAKMQAHASEQNHHHDHSHGHPHHHFHAKASAQDRVTMGGLVTLGLVHGIIPTPDSLAVLLVALSVQRTLLGLALILAYSLGIAAVLSIIGYLFLSSQELISRFSWLAWLRNNLPALAALTVVLLGITLITRTLGL